MKNFNIIAAGSATAMLLVPTLAFADNERHSKGIEIRIEKGIERVENKDINDAKKEYRRWKHATTTATAYSTQALRIQTGADTMLSFDARIAALIAGADTSEKAALDAKYAEFKADAANAKTEAGKVITATAQVNANNSTTTNATLLAQAKMDLKDSKGFFIEAKLALFYILRTLWN